MNYAPMHSAGQKGLQKTVLQPSVRESETPKTPDETRGRFGVNACHWPQPQLTVTSHAQSRVTHESRVSTTHASRLLTLSQAGSTCHTSQQAYLGRYGGTGKGQRPLNPRTPRTEAHSSFVARAHFHLNSPSQFVICSGRCAARRLR